MNKDPFVLQSHIQYLTQNEKLMSSCTQRLLQLQTDLQTKHLKQQLVSSLTMKDFSLRKLIEEQNLLIVYLNDELRQLKARRSQGIEIKQAIVEMEQKYLALGELKSIDETQRSKYLAKLKVEYNQLHDVLNQMTKQSSTLYELKIKLSQRNAYTEGIIAPKIVQYCSLKQQHDREWSINQKTRKITTQFRQETQKSNSVNDDLREQLKKKQTELQVNKLKLINLQKQVQKYESEKARLRDVQKAASKDNNLLKQTLKDKVETMKQKQQSLEVLKKQNQVLQKTKTQQSERLNDLMNQENQWKQKLAYEQSNREILKSKYHIVTKDKFATQTQLQNLSSQIIYLQNLKKSALKSCLSTQQTLQKNIYFIDQYMLINSQLLSEIQILLNQEIYQPTLGQIVSRKHFHANRSYQILELTQFLSRIMQKIRNTQQNVEILVTGFNIYKLC